jgi:FkbH-like protein
MKSLFTELRWLARPPKDFGERLKAVTCGETRPGVSAGSELQLLASHALDVHQLTRLAKSIEKLCASGVDLHPLVPFRLAVLSNSTLDLLKPALVASGARHGIALDIVQPCYDQVAQEALTSNSTVNSSRPDAVLIAIDYRTLPLKLTPGDAEAAAATVSGTLGYLEALRSGIKANCGALCIFQSFAPPPETLFGSLDRALPGTMRWLVDEVNREMAKTVVARGDVLLDVAGLAETVGLADWHNSQFWNMAKLPFCHECIPLYADHVARTIAAIRGKSRKVLILDLDSTVWGGAIGDEGLEGIRIAQGDAIGEAHLAVQRMALNLRERGVVLAVASKNADEVARVPFEKHPEMLLRLEHIAVFQANWNDKATNIQAIAEELALGLDALVFLEDNPAERALVRRLLPQVAVPELSEDPSDYTRTLAAAGYFESVAFVPEDMKRAGFYGDNARRASLKKEADGLEAYLASLEMTITFQPFDAMGRARITQLINKSNQYNLTTRRYTVAEVLAAENDPAVFTLQVRLRDVFGDNGMISVVICRPDRRGDWEIDTWLMSCRVLGRRVEQMVLRQLIEHAKASGVRRLIGRYIPTERNQLVADHYAKLGFTRTGDDELGETRWEFVLGKNAEPESAPMRVVETGFKPVVELVAV